MNIVLIACVQPIIEKRTISCEEYDLPLVANLMRVSMPMMSKLDWKATIEAQRQLFFILGNP